MDTFSLSLSLSLYLSLFDFRCKFLERPPLSQALHLWPPNLTVSLAWPLQIFLSTLLLQCGTSRLLY